MGAVYAAVDHVRRTTVALKTLHRMNPAAIYAIKDEFRSLCDVVHPNVVNLYELFSDGEHWFFTMELIEGTDFLRHLSGSLGGTDGQSEQRIRLAFRQLASGIGAIHDAGKLHLDIKPSNVLVTGDGRVVLLDFGLVRPSSTQRDELVGTPAYMAPEQATADLLTPASDWYALGIMLFEVLTKRHPFQGPSHRIVADKLLKTAPRASSLAADIPPELDELCAALLSREVERRPSTQEIWQALGVVSTPGRASLAPQSSTRPVFVGREGELHKLNECYAEAITGKAVLCLLCADSGMGKTALAERFLASLDHRQFPLVFAGRCFERESVPYNGIDNLADELGIYLGRLDQAEVEAWLSSDPSDLLRAFPVLGSVPAITRRCRQVTATADVQAARRSAIASLREILTGLSRRRPLVLFIDDLHWADLDSVRLLAELVAPPAPGPLFVLAASRNDAFDSGVPAALRELRATFASFGDFTPIYEVSLAPLDGAASLRVATASVRRDDGALASRIAESAGGNPFFIEVLARLGTAQGDTKKTGLSLDGIIVDQVAGQSAEAQRLLKIVAVAGQPINHEVAVAAADLGDRALHSLNELRAGRFVRTHRASQRDCIETYHDRIRESVRSSLQPAELRECHRRLALALEATKDAAPDFLARQFFAAGALQKAGGYATAAAEQAERALAFDRAADLYALACECVDEPARAGELRARQARALVSSGRCVLASGRYLAAAESVDVQRAFDFRRLAARQLFTAGHLEEALELLKPLLREVGLRYPRTQRGVLIGMVLALLRLKLRGMGFRDELPGQDAVALTKRVDVARSAAEGLASTDPMRAAIIMLEGVLLALRLGEPSRVAWALSHYGLLIGSTGKTKALASTEELFARAESLAKRVEAVETQAVVKLNRAKLSLSRGEWGDATRHADDCSSYVQRHCTEGWGYMTVAHNIALFALQSSGDLDELNQRAVDYIRVAGDVGDLYAEVSALIYSAAVALATDAPDRARETVRRAVGRWKKDRFLFQNWLALQAESQCDLYDGLPERAYQRLQSAWQEMEESHLLKLSVVRPFAFRLRAVAALAAAQTVPPGQRERYLRSARGDGGVLARMRRHDASGWADVVDAGLRSLAGDHAKASAGLANAAGHFQRAGMSLEALSAEFEMGRILGGTAGGELLGAAERCMTARGVRIPSRWARMATAAPR